MEPRITLTTSIHTCTAPIATPQSPPTNGKSCELSEQSWTALALPPNKESFLKGVEPRLTQGFGVAENFRRKL